MAGIAFVSLIIASWVVDQTGFESADQTAEVIVRDLANRVGGIETSIALVGLAAIAGFWFVGSLHLRLTARGPSAAALAAFGGGVAMVTLFLAGSAIRSATITVGSLASDPQVAKTLWLLEEGFSDVIGPTLIVFMLGISIVSIDRGDPPRSAAGSRGHCNTSASFSDGVIPLRVCRGRPLSECAALSRSVWVSRLMSVPLGKY